MGRHLKSGGGGWVKKKRSGGRARNVTAGCWWYLSGLRLWFFACLGTYLLCSGAVVGGRRAPRVPLRALVSARLAPAPRGKKVCRICVCRPMNKKYTSHLYKKRWNSLPCLWVGRGRGAFARVRGPKGARPPPPPVGVVGGRLSPGVGVIIPPPPGFPPPVATR